MDYLVGFRWSVFDLPGIMADDLWPVGESDLSHAEAAMVGVEYLEAGDYPPGPWRKLIL